MKSLTKLAVNIILLCDIMYASRLWRLIGGVYVQPVLLGSCAVLILLYCAVAMRKFYVKTVVLVGVLLAILVGQMVWFAARYEVRLELNSAFQYVWIFTFVVFYVAIRDGLWSYIYRAAVGYGSAYVILYLLISLGNLALPFMSTVLSTITISDLERGHRLYVHTAVLALSTFHWLHIVILRPVCGKALLMLVVCGAAVIITLSRVYILLILFIGLMHMFGVSNKNVGRVAFVVFALLSIHNLAGFFDDSLNPYALFKGDSSGNFRIYEYQMAIEQLMEHPFLGFGIAPNAKIAGHFLGNEYFSGSDLGSAGVWFDWGLAGLLLFLIASLMLFLPLLSEGKSRGDTSCPIFLAGCFIGLYGVISPALITGAPTYFSMILALKMSQRYSRVVSDAERWAA